MMQHFRLLSHSPLLAKSKKAGKHTPYVGTFSSGCAGAVNHGLEILGIGVIDVDLHECMMHKAAS